MGDVLEEQGLLFIEYPQLLGVEEGLLAQPFGLVVRRFELFGGMM
jgi:hypothetical protein